MKPIPLVRAAIGGIVVAAAVLLAAASAGGESRTPVFIHEEVLYGSGDGRLRWPVGVASATPDELVVTDLSGPRIVVFSHRNNEWIVERTVPLSAPPVSIIAAGERYLISLRGSSRLVALGRDGWQLGSLSLPLGASPGAMVLRPDGSILVQDRNTEQLFVLASTDTVTDRIPMTGLARALAATGGSVYAAFPHSGEVARYDGRGDEEFRWKIPSPTPVPAWPAGLAVDSGGEIVVVDRHGGRLLVFDGRGRPLGTGARPGRDVGLLRFPAAVAAMEGNRVAVADQGNGRVQIFRAIADEEAP